MLNSKSTVKQKINKRGRATEKFKNKTVDVNKDGSGTSVLKQKISKKGKLQKL